MLPISSRIRHQRILASHLLNRLRNLACPFRTILDLYPSLSASLWGVVDLFRKAYLYDRSVRKATLCIRYRNPLKLLQLWESHLYLTEHHLLWSYGLIFDLCQGICLRFLNYLDLYYILLTHQTCWTHGTWATATFSYIFN